MKKWLGLAHFLKKSSNCSLSLSLSLSLRHLFIEIVPVRYDSFLQKMDSNSLKAFILCLWSINLCLQKSSFADWCNLHLWYATSMTRLANFWTFLDDKLSNKSSPNEWRQFGLILNFQVKLLWLVFKQFSDKFGVLFITTSGHTVTLPTFHLGLLMKTIPM